MRRVNFKSDFDFILTITDCEGNELPFPNYDFIAYIYTTSFESAYVAKSENGVLTNCYNDNGKIHIVCDSHGLLSGSIKVEFHAQHPNSIYPDGRRLIVTPKPLDIKLVRDAGDCPCVDMDAELTTPVIAGGNQRVPMAMGPVKRHHISINAQPGYVYRFKQRIKLATVTGKNESETIVVDLSGKRIVSKKNDIPLSEAIIGVAGKKRLRFEYTIENDVITIQWRQLMGATGGDAIYAVLSEDWKDYHICVQTDKQGRKIFTPLESYREVITELDRPVITKKLISQIFGEESLHKVSGKQIQIWARSGKSPYRWRGFMSGKRFHSNRTHAYLRIRNVNRNKDKSEWVYINAKSTRGLNDWTAAEVHI